MKMRELDLTKLLGLTGFALSMAMVFAILVM